MLTIKRILCFTVNTLVVIAVFLIAEGLVAYLKHLIGIYSPPFKYGPYHTATRAYMIIIPILMALFDSRLMNKGFIGGLLTGCEVISPSNHNLSFIGCYLRTCAFFFLPLAYFQIFNPFSYHGSLDFYSIVSIRFVSGAFLFVLLFIPISVLLNNGRQGIHDYLLHIEFKGKKDNTSVHFRVVKTLILTIIITLGLSVILYLIIINSYYYKSYMYYETIVAEKMPNLHALQEKRAATLDRVDNLADIIRKELEKDTTLPTAILGVDTQIEEEKNRPYIVIDIATHTNLKDNRSSYLLAYEVALHLAKHEKSLDEFKIKLSNRYVFDLIAFEKAIYFAVRKKEGMVQVRYDHLSIGTNSNLPIGFTKSLLYLTGT